jgi:hypothetical protein
MANIAWCLGALFVYVSENRGGDSFPGCEKANMK